MAEASLLQPALSLAEHGYVIFPVVRRRKKPLIPRWQHNASCAPGQIRCWWRDSPWANIGLACGPSGIAVIDLDVKGGQDGLSAWRALCAAHHIDDWATLTVRTPSGGQHLYYHAPPGVNLGNSAGRLAPGIDVRARGGYVVAPPSYVVDEQHGYEGVYTWQGGTLIDLPAGLLDLLDPSRGAVIDRTTTAQSPALLTADLAPYVRAALDAELDRVRAATTGTRNETLNQAAFALGQLVGASWANLPRSDVEQALLAAALACGLGERETLATIRSGLDGGARQPRPEPASRSVGRTFQPVLPGQPAQPRPVSGCPDLPECARLTLEQATSAESAGRWLDEYTAFSTRASPMTPRAFHVAGGLFLGGLVIARRLCLPVSVAHNAIYPNLYLLYVGPSTIQRKSTALRALRGLLDAAGLNHFLLADRQTPEALALDLTTRVPHTFEAWSPTLQARWLQERGLAAQRGWLLEEAGQLLDSFNRDFTAGLLPLVLDLYDSPAEALTRNTLSRGRELVQQPYLNIFGVTTYGDMAEHLGKRRLWSNGLFARFALVGSDDVGMWRFWPEPTQYPADLVARLRDVATRLLPVPTATLVERNAAETDGEPGTIREVVISEPLSAAPVRLERDGEAWNAWERYARATSFDMLAGGSIGESLQASYGRLGTMLVKIGMILATFDAERLPVVIEPRHVYRAQTIVEDWRANLHDIRGKLPVSGEDQPIPAARVKEELAKTGGEWVSRRDLLRALGAKEEMLREPVNELLASGEIEQEEVRNPHGSATVRYRLIVE